jgi:peptidyl-prolyl cis-trans isomerase D
MISFFRKFLSSWVVLGLFGIILISFAVTGFGTGGSGGLGQLAGGNDDVAKIGSDSIASATIERRIKAQFDMARQQTPTLTFSDFMAQGAFDAILDQTVDSNAVSAFADKYGMTVSSRLVDSELAKKSEFDDNTGKFDREIYRQSLGRLGFDEKSYEDDVRSNIVYRQLAIPAGWKITLPTQLVAPYAGLMLEKRYGVTASISASRFAGGPAPTEAELTAFYSRSIAKYTVPETRVIRYALFDRSKVSDQAVPTDAEIEAAYKAKSADYAPRQTRTLTQVIVADQAKAKMIATQVTNGADLTKAAKDAGSDAIKLDPQEEKGFASLSSAEVAKAAFSAEKGSLAGPVKSPLGWHVVRVDQINAIGGKSLAQVRDTLMTVLSASKRETVYAEYINKLDEEIGDGKSFDDVVKANALTVITTASITAGGIASDGSGKPLDAALQPMLTDAFSAEPEDEPVLIALDNGQREALYDLESVNAAAPKPLASIRDQVVADFVADRAFRAARKAAGDAVAQINRGIPAAKALADAGLGGGQPLSGQRGQVQQMGKDAPMTLTTLFQLSKGKGKVVESGDGKSFTIVALERLEQADASQIPGLVENARSQLNSYGGQEYVQQLLGAIRADVGVKRNKDVIARLKNGLQKPGGQ